MPKFTVEGTSGRRRAFLHAVNEHFDRTFSECNGYMGPFVDVEFHVSVGEFPLDIAPGSLFSGIPGYLNLIPGNAHVAQAKKEFALDAHDRLTGCRWFC